MSEELLKSFLIENKRLLRHNKVLAEQISIAVEGLEALISVGDVAGIPKKTLEAMKKCEQEILQNDYKE